MKKMLLAYAVSCVLVSCASADSDTPRGEAADDVAVAHSGGAVRLTGECGNSLPDLDPYSLASQNKRLVKKAMTELFGQHDLTAIDRYWREPYIQHNPQAPNGTDGLRQLVASLPSTNTYETGGVAAEGDIVMLHGRATGPSTTLIIVDMFRLEDNKIVEHWDVLQNEVPASQTASGNPMFTPCP